jgi:nucleoside-diphosphate-sugar epimerase
MRAGRRPRRAFVAQAIQGLPLTIYGDGRRTRSFQYWRPGRACTPGAVGRAQAVNIGTQFELSVRDFAELINR